MVNSRTDLSHWNWRFEEWRGPARHVEKSLSNIVQRFGSDRGITIAGRNNIEDVLDTLLDNRSLTTGYIVALDNLPSDAIDGIPNSPSVVSQVYPNYADYEGHKKAVDLMHILTGWSKELISSEYPGLGFTGTEDESILQGIAYSGSFPAFLNGTVIHDVLVTLSEDFPTLRGIDGEIYGSNNKAISALYMALDSLSFNLVSAIASGDFSKLIPEEENFLDFIGFNSLPEQKKQTNLFQTVTNLGEAASTIAAKLAIHYADEDFADQIVIQSAASTLGGFIGDKVIYEAFEVEGGFPSLTVRNLYTRFYAEYFRELTNFGADALNDAIIEAFDIEDPLSQITVSAFGSSIFYNAYGALIDDAFGSSFPVQYLGLDPNRSYEISFAAIKGDIIQNLYGGIQSFAGAQLFSLIDDAWSDANLSNLGSSLGGTIGSLVLPGIGTLVGQVVGGFVWDLVDNPEAFYSVRLNLETHEFEFNFEFEDDNGETAIAEQMSQTASETLNLLTGMIGGIPISADTHLYGLKEDEFQYRSRTINSFDDFEAAITGGIVSQIKTVKFEGGDRYIKHLIGDPDYNPSLAVLFEDLEVAREYSIHKEDPFLYGQTIVNISDPTAREYLLEDWHRIRNRANLLGLGDADFNDGGEFVSGTNAAEELDGHRGPDFLYGGFGTDILNGQGGKDTILVRGEEGEKTVNGGAGTDLLIADYSDYALVIGGSETRTGIFNTNEGEIKDFWYERSASRKLLSHSGIERFNITGSKNDDHLIAYQGDIVDGFRGIDKLDLDLSNATSDVEINLTLTNDQVSYGSTKISNFEKIGQVVTGSGNDTIELTSLASSKGGKVDGGAGTDLLIADYSDYALVIGGSETRTGIFNTNEGEIKDFWYERSASRKLLSHSGIERFNIIGSKNDDHLVGLDKRDILTGNGGNDLLQGMQGNDILRGGEGKDILDGGVGNDKLIGGAGDDLMRGRSGNDVLLGGKGNDTLIGGSGNDTLLGGSGNDKLIGGGGKDTFLITRSPNGGRINIKDFTDKVDRLKLSEDLDFMDLQVTVNRAGSATLIKDVATNKTLAVLQGFDSSLIDIDDFVGI